MHPYPYAYYSDPNQPQAYQRQPIHVSVTYHQPGAASTSYPSPQPAPVSYLPPSSYGCPAPAPQQQQQPSYYSSDPQGYALSSRTYLPTPTLASPAHSPAFPAPSPRPSSSGSSFSTSSHYSSGLSYPSSHPSTFTREDSPLTPLQLSDLARLSHVHFQPGNMSYDQQYNEAIRDLGTMKVDWLKAVIKRMNSQVGTYMKLTGRKDEIHSRIRDSLTSLYHMQDKSKFAVAKRIIADVRVSLNPNAPSYSSNAYASTVGYGASTSTGAGAGAGYNAATGGYSYGATGGYNAGASGSGAYGAGAATGRAAGGLGGLPPPRFGGYNAATGASGSGGTGGAGGAGGVGAGGGWQNQRLEEVPIKFRPSPFFRVEKSLTAVVTCPKAAQGDRKVVACSFGLTEAQRALLSKARESKSNPQYQVRVYCTSDQFFSGGRPLANQFPAPIEFPPSAEIKLNGAIVQANVKGIKKQPGTAPPVNLSGAKGVTMNMGAATTNRVEVAYVSTDKVYYLVCYLVEYTPIPAIVNRVKAGKTRSKEEVIANIIEMNADEEIEATALGVSLRDPLSFARIDTPIRSVHCGHISCFDAETWFEVNEQTPTWGCPICSRVLKVEDMIVDGYLQDILKECNENVDEVRVEPDGTWRSDDDKHGTAKPRTAPASTANSTRNSPGADDKGKGRETPAADGAYVNGGDLAGAANGGGTVLLIDSDDDDDDQPQAKRPRLDGGFSGAATPVSAGGSVQPTNGGGGGGGAKKGEVLDLTLSSDDEDAPVRPPPARPGALMARVSSTGSERKGTPLANAVGGGGGGGGAVPGAGAGGAVANVQADIDAMNRRMEQQYGKDWRKEFGYDGDDV